MANYHCLSLLHLGQEHVTPFCSYSSDFCYLSGQLTWVEPNFKFCLSHSRCTFEIIFQLFQHYWAAKRLPHICMVQGPTRNLGRAHMQNLRFPSQILSFAECSPLFSCCCPSEFCPLVLQANKIVDFCGQMFQVPLLGLVFKIKVFENGETYPSAIFLFLLLTHFQPSLSLQCLQVVVYFSGFIGVACRRTGLGEVIHTYFIIVSQKTKEIRQWTYNFQVFNLIEYII